jgi:hypothetical protein
MDTFLKYQFVRAQNQNLLLTFVDFSSCQVRFSKNTVSDLLYCFFRAALDSYLKRFIECFRQSAK